MKSNVLFESSGMVVGAMEQELNRRDVVKRSDGYTAKDSKLCDSIIMDGDTQVNQTLY